MATWQNNEKNQELSDFWRQPQTSYWKAKQGLTYQKSVLLPGYFRMELFGAYVDNTVFIAGSKFYDDPEYPLGARVYIIAHSKLKPSETITFFPLFQDDLTCCYQQSKELAL